MIKAYTDVDGIDLIKYNGSLLNSDIHIWVCINSPIYSHDYNRVIFLDDSYINSDYRTNRDYGDERILISINYIHLHFRNCDIDINK